MTMLSLTGTRAPARRVRRAGTTLGAAALLALAAGAAVHGPVASAQAADAGVYGEIGRWGGTATGDAEVGAPTGFGVDRADDSVYLLDRTTFDTAAGTATFRLRKFAETGGDPQGSVSFSVTSPTLGAPPVAEGVAVDHEAGHVYVLVAAKNAAGNTVPQQIRVYSTEPSATALVAPSDVPSSILVGTADDDLYLPVGLAVDPTTHDVLVAASTLPSPSTPTVARFRGVAGDGDPAGDPHGTWTDTPGASDLFATSVTADAQGDVLVPENTPAAFGGLARIPKDGGATTHPLPAASDGYAGTFAGSSRLLEQVPSVVPFPDDGSGLGLTAVGTELDAAPDGTMLGVYGGIGMPAEPFVLDGGSAFGIRRFAADGSNLGIVAGGTSSGACALAGAKAGALGVAAGSDGRFFTLSGVDPDPDQLFLSQHYEVVEFGPGGTGCDNPSGSMAVQYAGATVPVDGTVTTAGPTTLDLSGADLHGWDVDEVDWDLDGDTTDGLDGDGFEVKDQADFFIALTTPALTHDVTLDAGTHTVRARILSTAGTSAVISRDIEVLGAPTAVFSAPAVATVGAAVTFDASASKPNPVTSGVALSYAWDFGDGDGSFVAGPVSQTHTYAAAGTYAARVRVTETVTGMATTSSAHQVVVTAKAADGPGPGQQGPATDPGPGPGTPAAPTVTTPAPPPPVAHDASATNLRPKLTATATGLTVALSCPTTKASCSATVTVKATVATKKGHKTVKTTITVGSGKATLLGGKWGKVTIKLSKAAKTALAKLKKLPIKATISATDTYGGKKTTTLSATLKQAAAKKSHGK
jgi:hypothetical protein